MPQAGIPLSGFPNYTRTTAIVLGLVLGVLFFDHGRLSTVRLKRLDLPIIIWCLCPLASSLANSLGIYDGLSGVLSAFINYGIPYFIGRLYFSDRVGMRELAVGLVFAVLCYTPLILYELRMSPQLHRYVYGFLQIPFHMIWRLGWYRPMVFLRHGLELGLIVAVATITSVWLWQNKSIARIGRLSAGFVSVTLLVVCLLCRALNGYTVLIMGLGTLYFIKSFGSRVVLVFILLFPPVYVFSRVVMDWHGEQVVQTVWSIDPLRARSLRSRISHEITLVSKALERPLFGWGGWNRNRAEELEKGAMGKRSITDSFWIIVLGQRGLVGLISVSLVLLVPIWLLARHMPAVAWSYPENGPAASLSMALLGFTIDCLANAMISPIFFVIAGALMAYQPLLASRGTGKTSVS